MVGVNIDVVQVHVKIAIKIVVINKDFVTFAHAIVVKIKIVTTNENIVD